MSLVRVLFGAILGLLLLGVLWFAAILPPPESLSQRVAVWVATGTADDGQPISERIPCPVLRKLRFYVVCTDDCESTWRIVGVWGLQPRILADLARIPPEQPGVARRRINMAVGREALTLHHEAGREMIGCYLRLDGLQPAFILPAGGRASVDAARGNEDVMLDLARQLAHPEALSRLDIRDSAGAFETRFEYWDTSLPERPVLELEVRIGHDGRLLGVDRRVLSTSARQ
jgi:hypothetical protein